MRSEHAKFALVLAGVAVALLSAEIFTRGSMARSAARTLEKLAVSGRVALPPPGQVAKFSDLIWPSRNSRMVYELRPGLDVSFHGARLCINEAGYRGRVVSRVKPPGVIRIVGIGDSVMFGWGVADEQTFLSVLERRLNDELPQRKWETVNLAVLGYNSAMEIETLRVRGLDYQPDIVVVCMVGNDMDLPDFIQNSPDVRSLRRSFLWEKLTAGRRSHRKALSEIGLASIPRDPTNPAHPECNPDAVPAPYRDMVGAGAVARALLQLRALADQHHFKVILVPYWGAKPFMIDAANVAGFQLADAEGQLKDYMREHGIPQFEGSVLARSKTDLHPSAAGHRLLADIVFREIQKRGLAAK